jgi:hypothetical protein
MSNFYGALFRVDSREYKLFISHAWDYGEEYDRLVKLLNAAFLFNWSNFSVPEEAQLPAHPTLPKSYRYLVHQLDTRIMQVDCLLVLARMYIPHRQWIQSEIEAAQAFQIPIIAVKPLGQERMPSMLMPTGVNDTVAWNTDSIVASIRRHAKPVHALGGLYGMLS